MVIFDQLYNHIDGLTPKVIETGHGFLLNTQYYLKNNMSPVPFEHARVYGSPYQLNLYKKLHCVSYSWNRSYCETPAIKDDYIPGRYYIFTQSGYVAGDRKMFSSTMDEANSKCNITWANIDWGDVQFLEYVYQTEQFLYFTCISDKTWYLKRYDKVNNTQINCFNLGYTYSRPNAKCIYADDEYFFFISYSDNNICITRYARIANTQITASTYRGQMTTTANYNLTQILQPVQLSANEYGAYVYNCGQTDQPLGIYSVDLTKTFSATWADACTYTPCTINYDADHTEIRYNTSVHSLNTYYEMFIHEVNNIKYLQICIHNKNFENAAYIPYQGIYTLKVIDNENFEFISYSQIDATQQINGYMFDDTYTICVVAINQGFKIYKFSDITKNYEYTGVELSYIYDVGLDENGRLWYLKTDGSVHLVNLSDAQDVNITFEKPYYEYTGHTIETYITFKALTYAGLDATGTFRLIIEGPAIFQENNQRELYIDYTEEVMIPLKITGAAPITIYPKYISERE